MGGVSVSELWAAGFSYADLLLGGVPSQELHRYPFATVTQAPGDKFWSRNQQANFIPGPAPPFPGSFPLVASLPGIWFGALSRAREDPCNAAVLHPHFVLTHPHSGFCSRMNNFVNEMLVAMYSKRPVAPCGNPEMKNLWSENFDVPDLPVCPVCAIKANDNSKEWLWSAGFHVAADHQTPEMEFTKRFLYKKLFVPKGVHLQAAGKLQQDLGLVDVPYVGVHIRRADKVFESLTFRKTTAFADNALRICQVIGCAKIFVASDSESERPLMAEYIAKYNASVQVVEQPRMPPETYAQRGNLTKDAAAALMVDIMLLIRATAYVGTASSNVDRFIWFQRDPASQSVSLDDFGSFLQRSG